MIILLFVKKNIMNSGMYLMCYLVFTTVHKIDSDLNLCLVLNKYT